MSMSHFIGVAILVVSLTVAGLIVAAIAGIVFWSDVTPVTVILLGLISEAIKRLR